MITIGTSLIHWGCTYLVTGILPYADLTYTTRGITPGMVRFTAYEIASNPAITVWNASN